MAQRKDAAAKAGRQCCSESVMDHDEWLGLGDNVVCQDLLIAETARRAHHLPVIFLPCHATTSPCHFCQATLAGFSSTIYRLIATGLLVFFRSIPITLQYATPGPPCQLFGTVARSPYIHSLSLHEECSYALGIHSCPWMKLSTLYASTCSLGTWLLHATLRLAAPPGPALSNSP